MGLIRKTLFIGSTVATGGVPLVRWNSSAEKATKKSLELQREQNRLLAEQNRLLAASHASGAVTSRPTPADRASRKESVGPSADAEWRADNVPGSKEYDPAQTASANSSSASPRAVRHSGSRSPNSRSAPAPGSPDGLATRHEGMAGRAARLFPLSLDV